MGRKWTLTCICSKNLVDLMLENTIEMPVLKRLCKWWGGPSRRRCASPTKQINSVGSLSV
ncbi:hypothetical protein Tcan_17227 [Toxocara canis]|uniref:Uncharacterized protein n=1 Tax=Toxocara canis TaxID=6265 RepID=A0A0B2UYR8_TOXCA|nr:hypothetical protein Tcan_17227 [Toxocara canis]